jgi:hypothetical protein
MSAYTPAMRMALWELFFMLVVLKIPVVYLCVVVWWAIKAEPRPLEGAARPVLPEPAPTPWQRGSPRRRRPGPHGSPARRYSRRPAPARAKAGR